MAGRTSLLFVVLAALAACNGTPPIVVTEDPRDVPLRDLDATLMARFDEGDAQFESPFLATTGLGPLYIRQRCADCHAGDGRGPGSPEKMSVMQADGLTLATDQSALAYGHTVRPYFVAPATQALLPPMVAGVATFTRSAPQVVGRGYIEAIRDDEIERMEAEQATRTDGVSGRIHRVSYVSETNAGTGFHSFVHGQSGLVGRFGVKARLATIDDFVADAYQGDMGITSPLRPTEPANPDGATDDGRAGVDITADVVNVVADYVRLLDIPKRTMLDPHGAVLFASAGCATCHVPSLHTRADYPIAPLADIDAAVYTDVLVHDMGRAATDGQVEEGDVAPTEYRTAPLTGVRILRTFMHDGRAHTVDEAIRDHAGDGSEANASVDAYLALSPDDRTTLDTYVSHL